MPFAEAFRPLRAVIGAVDLDAGQLRAGVFQLALLREALGIEIIPPLRVDPAADANENAHAPLCARASRGGKTCPAPRPSSARPSLKSIHRIDVPGLTRRRLGPHKR